MCYTTIKLDISERRLKMYTNMKELTRLMGCFRGSFINSNCEMIIEPKSNVYFLLENIETDIELKCKVLEHISRSACKSEPFNTKAKNIQLHENMLDGINEFLGTNFNILEMEDIYCKLGNGINRKLALEFIESNYNMDLIEKRNRLI